MFGSNMDNNQKKKIAIVSVCSLVLVAMVVALTIGSLDTENSTTNVDVSSSQKAIQNICQSTDYQQTCVDSLKASGSGTSDPKELIEVAFNAAIKYINEAAKNSSVLEELQTDPRAKTALQNCRELADHAVSDLERSFAKFNGFDASNFDEMLMDLKIWLSGAITHQETCLDGFEEVPGDAGDRMRQALTTAMQLTSNSLAMVAEVSTVIESMGVEGFNSRRLLFDDLPVLGHGDDLPYWLDVERRELLTATPVQIRPDFIVAKDGSGKYRTINEALKDVPERSNRTIVLYIKAGIYEEKVQINSSIVNLMIIGDGPTQTKITGRLNFIDGTNTYQTATVAVQGDNFIARDIGFENSAGAEKHQAVALRVSADKVIFYNCQMDGYQDTLYAHTYRQFYRDCVISGTIDFIFGDSAAVFQGCTLLIRKPMDNQQNIVTAQGRKDLRQPTGLVLQNCTFKADPTYYPFRNKLKSYLGRPWKEYSRTIILESFLDDCIQPQGWLPWNATFALETLFYTEFNNRGPAAPKSERSKWAGVKELPSERIERFTASKFLDGNRWIPPSGVPYAAGFIFPVPKEDPNIKYSPVVPEENKDLGKAIDKEAFIAKLKPAAENKPDSSEKSDNDKKSDSEKKSLDDSKSDHYDTSASSSSSSSSGSIPQPETAVPSSVGSVFQPDTAVPSSVGSIFQPDTAVPSSVGSVIQPDTAVPSSVPVTIPESGIAAPPTSFSYANEDAPALSPGSQPKENKFSLLKLFFRA
ncbi:probable pectinesterase/pectinesterase inhibitor 58 [Primulina huaijiensis]|uniref:probable pectinesterase/pectinesterase inhibitor 58 n=1 Tax=Primulina huaijiensis TaxID=1492673 RepID=UPI003CC78BAA